MNSSFVMGRWWGRFASWLGWGTQTPSGDVFDWTTLESRIGYRIEDKGIFVQAFKHRSYLSVTSESRCRSYERLEFLGDAVLNLVTATRLYQEYPEVDEGDLTKNKASLVNKHVLADRARKMGLGEFVFLSDGEERSGGRDRSSILADLIEAVIGAIFLDGGYREARDFIQRCILTDIQKQLSDDMTTNYKGELLELVQAQGWGLPQYIVVAEDGPEHSKEFSVNVSIRSKEYGFGKGGTKKAAEQQAAREALQRLRREVDS